VAGERQGEATSGDPRRDLRESSMVIRIASVFAGAGVIENVVSGRSIEFAPEDSILTIAAAISASTGTMTVRLTDEVVLDESALPVAAAPAPIIPDHILVPKQAMARGDHLIIRITAAGAATITTLIEVAPI
jgi:hypothetical protein